MDHKNEPRRDLAYERPYKQTTVCDATIARVKEAGRSGGVQGAIGSAITGNLWLTIYTPPC